MKQNPKKKSSQENQNVDDIKIVRGCPVCKEEYGLDDMFVLEENKGTHLVHSTCPHCRNAIMSVVLISKVGMSSVGVLTDLNIEDALRLKEASPINQDMVIDFHDFFRNNTTKFIEKIIA